MSDVCLNCGSTDIYDDSDLGFRQCQSCGCLWGDDEDDPDYADEEALDLGACCRCGKHDSSVRNLINLSRRTSIPGTGWGCMVCNLPLDGASAIVCDECLEEVALQGPASLRYAIHGYPTAKERIEIDKLPPGEFKHTKEMHERYEMGG